MVFNVPAERTVTVSETGAPESVVLRQVGRIKTLKVGRKETEADVAELADQLPLLPVLMSMPGADV